LLQDSSIGEGRKTTTVASKEGKERLNRGNTEKTFELRRTPLISTPSCTSSTAAKDNLRVSLAVDGEASEGRKQRSY